MWIDSHAFAAFVACNCMTVTIQRHIGKMGDTSYVRTPSFLADVEAVTHQMASTPVFLSVSHVMLRLVAGHLLQYTDGRVSEVNKGCFINLNECVAGDGISYYCTTSRRKQARIRALTLPSLIRKQFVNRYDLLDNSSC